MWSGVELLSVRNIAIRVHPSFLLALAWVVYYWGFASDDGLRGAAFGAFLLTAVFVCVAGHELAHSFVALRYGLAVHDITLLPIGGVARIEHAPITPRREAMIAVAGPILNLVVALGLLPAAAVIVVTRDIDHPVAFLRAAQETSVAGLVLHLWLANMMLAGFNLLPAFPMDGGRILRAALTVLTNRVVATRIAVVLGQIFAGGLVLAGIYAGDILLPLVAIFIVVAAVVESRMIEVERVLKTLPVSQFAIWDMGGVSPDSPLTFALRGGSRDVVVTEQGLVVGMLWRDDVLKSVNRSKTLKVLDVMDRNVASMDVDASVYDVHRKMITAGWPAIPIVEAGVYRGIFTADRLTHVHRYVQERYSRRERGVVELFNLLLRSRFQRS